MRMTLSDNSRDHGERKITHVLEWILLLLEPSKEIHEDFEALLKTENIQKSLREPTVYLILTSGVLEVVVGWGEKETEREMTNP